MTNLNKELGTMTRKTAKGYAVVGFTSKRLAEKVLRVFPTQEEALAESARINSCLFNGGIES